MTTRAIVQLEPAAPLPEPRQLHASAASACHMYVFGGVAAHSYTHGTIDTPHLKYYEDLWEYTFPAQGGACGQQGGVHGKWRHLATTVALPPCDVTNDGKCATVAPETGPLGRSGASLVHRSTSHGDSLILFGGYDGTVELDEVAAISVVVVIGISSVVIVIMIGIVVVVVVVSSVFTAAAVADVDLSQDRS